MPWHKWQRTCSLPLKGSVCCYKGMEIPPSVLMGSIWEEMMDSSSFSLIASISSISLGSEANLHRGSEDTDCLWWNMTTMRGGNTSKQCLFLGMSLKDPQLYFRKCSTWTIRTYNSCRQKKTCESHRSDMVWSHHRYGALSPLKLFRCVWHNRGSGALHRHPAAYVWIGFGGGGELMLMLPWWSWRARCQSCGSSRRHQGHRGVILKP